MNKKQARDLFNKYVNNECTPKEIELLNNFLDSFQDRNELWSDLDFNEELQKKIWSKIQLRTNIGKRTKKYPFMSLLRYAAIFIGIGIGIFVWAELKKTERPEPVSWDNEVVLKMGDNSLKKVNTSGKGVLVNTEGKVIASQEGDLIVYEQGSMAETLVYNEVHVPRGETIRLVLSDGTSVHLNSGTSLRFPINFTREGERKVFLKGEAYFEVAKNAAHPFSVTAGDMGIRVLGTHFNVSSYKYSEEYVVLVEGSVEVQDYSANGSGNAPKTIKPGEKASLLSGSIDVKDVDVEDYLGWRDGSLIFNNETFADIIPKIERRYNVNIENNLSSLETVRFNGKFKEESIVDLLDTFKESVGFDYQIIEDKIIIKTNDKSMENNK
ncbi:DUF4974 domain-containing protein [Arenibacter sp. F26102]|uniref:FecR family protein n=1 Tax=Arenibacter sp. F26102 TaxID=2926416 RepID=UPI001FF38A9F|nr:FecR family protein [Arenibacter sp. F26102]MCK0146027.1 DUF4974 domain-containing protein [Arenibacter sp. F26102]